MTAIVPTNAQLPAHGVPPAIRSVCILDPHFSQYFNTATALRDLKAAGHLESLPVAAVKARASLAPVDHNRLTDRLTALGMMMAPNRPPAEARVWLNEMTRLLSDLPEDILADVIDGLVKSCKFLPTCAEIREQADALTDERRRMVGQLEAMVRYIDSGQPIPAMPKWEPPRESEPIVPCTQAEALAIMEEFGLSSEMRAIVRPNAGPRRKPTRADYIAMGVDPAVLDRDTDGSPKGGGEDAMRSTTAGAEA